MQTTLERYRECAEGTCDCKEKPYCAHANCMELANGFMYVQNDEGSGAVVGFCSSHLWGIQAGKTWWMRTGEFQELVWTSVYEGGNSELS